MSSKKPTKEDVEHALLVAADHITHLKMRILEIAHQNKDLSDEVKSLQGKLLKFTAFSTLTSIGFIAYTLLI